MTVYSRCYARPLQMHAFAFPVGRFPVARRFETYLLNRLSNSRKQFLLSRWCSFILINTIIKSTAGDVYDACPFLFRKRTTGGGTVQHVAPPSAKRSLHTVERQTLSTTTPSTVVDVRAVRRQQSGLIHVLSQSTAVTGSDSDVRCAKSPSQTRSPWRPGYPFSSTAAASDRLVADDAGDRDEGPDVGYSDVARIFGQSAGADAGISVGSRDASKSSLLLADFPDIGGVFSSADRHRRDVDGVSVIDWSTSTSSSSSRAAPRSTYLTQLISKFTEHRVKVELAERRTRCRSSSPPLTTPNNAGADVDESRLRVAAGGCRPPAGDSGNGKIWSSSTSPPSCFGLPEADEYAVGSSRIDQLLRQIIVRTLAEKFNNSPFLFGPPVVGGACGAASMLPTQFGGGWPRFGGAVPFGRRPGEEVSNGSQTVVDVLISGGGGASSAGSASSSSLDRGRSNAVNGNGGGAGKRSRRRSGRRGVADVLSSTATERSSGSRGGGDFADSRSTSSGDDASTVGCYGGSGLLLGGRGGHAGGGAPAAASLAATKKTRPKRGQYRKYNRQLLMEAVRAVQQGDMSVHRAGSFYGVPHSTLEYKVKERHLLRQRKIAAAAASAPGGAVDDISSSATASPAPLQQQQQPEHLADSDVRDDSSAGGGGGGGRGGVGRSHDDYDDTSPVCVGGILDQLY